MNGVPTPPGRGGRRALAARLSRRAAIVCLGVLMTMPLLGTRAFASFTSTPAAAAMALSAPVLNPPTNPSASASCALILLVPQANLSWTATTSSFADGYQILRSSTSGGPYSLITSLPTSLGITFIADAASLVGGHTYYYVVRATRGNWTADSAEVAVSIPVLVCL